jgi:hypothetical protein
MLPHVAVKVRPAVMIDFCENVELIEMLKNFLRPRVTNFCNKLECLPLASLVNKAGAYPSETLLRCSTLGWAPGLAHKQ